MLGAAVGYRVGLTVGSLRTNTTRGLFQPTNDPACGSLSRSFTILYMSSLSAAGVGVGWCVGSISECATRWSLRKDRSDEACMEPSTGSPFRPSSESSPLSSDVASPSGTGAGTTRCSRRGECTDVARMKSTVGPPFTPSSSSSPLSLVSTWDTDREGKYEGWNPPTTCKSSRPSFLFFPTPPSPSTPS